MTKPNKMRFLTGGGEMGNLIRSVNWSATPLGDPTDWSPTLKTHVSTMLHNKIGMYIAWGKEYIQLYNDAYRPILGSVKHPAAMGISTRETFAEIWHIIESMFADVMAGNSVGFPDFMLPLERNGFVEECFFDFSYSPIFEIDGTVGGVLVTVIETTEKKRNFERLSDRQRQLDFTIEAADLATWDLDPKTNKFVGNDRLKKWFGLETDEEIALPVAFDRIIVQDRERVANAIEAALKPGSDGSYEIEYTIFNPVNNKYKNVLARGKALFDKDDRPFKFSGILQDVTSFADITKHLKEVGERFETMANNMPNLAWIAHADGWIYWYNKQWYNYTGTVAKDMEGWGWKSVHDPIEFPRVLKVYEESIKTGHPFEMVFPIKGADGIFRPFLTRTVPIKNDTGEIINWLGTNTDITKQKEAETLKENFLSMASHELKTPVTTIKAYAQLLETIAASGEAMPIGEMLQKIVKQADKLTSIIEDLLDITKIQKNKFVFNNAVFNFNELVNEAVEDMQRISGRHTIETNFDSNIEIHGDRDKIIQVINNLISNAVKYSPQSDRIIIATRLLDGGVQLSVQDFGIGIEGKKHQNIFEQFYRISDSSQYTFPGLGIGLYIASEIVTLLGGKIWLESEMNKGSTFYVWLPAKT